MRLIAISSYPKRGVIHGKGVVGGGTYFKTLLTSIERIEKDLDITVMAEVFTKQEAYKEGAVRVERVWTRNSLLSLVRLFIRCLRNPARTVLMSHEIFMFGSYIHIAFFAPQLLIFRLLGKKVVIILHQVPTDFTSLNANSLFRSIYASFSKLYFKYILFVSKKIIVFEKQLKSALGDNPKVSVISLAVEEKAVSATQAQARAKLKLPSSQTLVLFFGFLSPYKGIDKLVKHWPRNSKANLIIAGGPNPNHTTNTKYMKYVSDLQKSARAKGIITTGFIDESLIGHYFSAADIVAFPYIEFISSSAPLAFAFTYEKPFMVSPPLLSYFKSTDFIACAEHAGLKPSDFTHTYDEKSIEDRIKYIMEHKNKYVSFSKGMKIARSWKRIAKQYIDLLKQ